MTSGNIFVSELSTTKHLFKNYHFCRGNSNKRKSRLGIIVKGQGTYIYLNKRLKVSEGDTVFIPENIYCYSEWHGAPDIEVVYLSCFIHYENFSYEPQILNVDPDTRDSILAVCRLLSCDTPDELEAYSLFYRVLKSIIPGMVKTEIVYDKTLQRAIEYLTANWNKRFSVSDLAKSCCVSESSIYHIFQRELGETPVRFLNSIRINVAIEYLETTRYSVYTIGRLVAFNSENHFRRVFFEFTGMTPSQFRKNQK